MRLWISGVNLDAVISFNRLETYLDLVSIKQSFFWLSAALLLFLPMNGLRLYLARPAPLFSHAEDPRSRNPVQAIALTTYLAAFEKNTLFGNIAASSSAPVLRASVAELTKDYRLKGVVLAGEPEAILEDARTQKTIFVKAGGPLGDLTVKEIKEGLIVLEYLGEEIKLEIQ